MNTYCISSAVLNINTAISDLGNAVELAGNQVEKLNRVIALCEDALKLAREIDKEITKKPNIPSWREYIQQVGDRQ